MSDEYFEPCTPPDSLFDTNAIAEAMAKENFMAGELVMSNGRLPRFPVDIVLKMQRYLFNELRNQLFWSGKGYINLTASQGPWATSDMWRKR